MAIAQGVILWLCFNRSDHIVLLIRGVCMRTGKGMIVSVRV